MGNIAQTFKNLRLKGEKALIPYVTAGDPSLAATKKLLFALEAAGADLIEIGVPFSDPTADGPVIQRASERSLKNGASLTAVLDLVGTVRPGIGVPLVLFGYYNPILTFGPERFAARAREVGVDGILVVDLPPEESNELRRYTDPLGIDFISLVTPTCDDERLGKISDDASGFLYYVSVTGVTGTRSSLPPDTEGNIARIRAMTDLPVVVGFGIANPATAARAARAADGVVVGSALVSIVELHERDENGLVHEVEGFIRSMKAPLLGRGRTIRPARPDRTAIKG
jgi:tryptophan synthase alpha chain